MMHLALQNPLGQNSKFLPKDVKYEKVRCGVKNDEYIDNGEVFLQPTWWCVDVDRVEDEGE